MGSSITYAKMKTVWPAGARDVLVFNHIVKHEKKCWMQSFSIDDERCPEVKGVVRIVMHDNIVYFEPVNDINGYVVKCDSTFDYGGSLPVVAVA